MSEEKIAKLKEYINIITLEPSNYYIETLDILDYQRDQKQMLNKKKFCYQKCLNANDSFESEEKSCLKKCFKFLN